LVLCLETGKSYSFASGLDAQKLRPIGETVPLNNLWSAPRWSDDGRQIIIVGGLGYSYMGSVAPPEAQTEIWTMNADGTGVQQITKNPGWDLAPAWSSDKHTIAFVRRTGTDHSDVGIYSYNLWTTNTVSHSEKQLTSNPESYFEMLSKNLLVIVATPMFSPDGRQIAFEEKTTHLGETEGNYEGGIYQMNVDGTNRKRLSDGELVQWVP
jgi:Tol biopolymer transport system component